MRLIALEVAHEFGWHDVRAALLGFVLTALIFDDGGCYLELRIEWLGRQWGWDSRA